MQKISSPKYCVTFSSPSCWKSGEFSACTKHFWSFTAKHCCSILLKNWSRWGLVLKCQKIRMKGIIQVSIHNRHNHPMYSWVELTLLAFKPLWIIRLYFHTSSQFKSIWDLWTSRHELQWISCMEPLKAFVFPFFFFYDLKCPIYSEFFVAYKPSQDFPLAV